MVLITAGGPRPDCSLTATEWMQEPLPQAQRLCSTRARTSSLSRSPSVSWTPLVIGLPRTPRAPESHADHRRPHSFHFALHRKPRGAARRFERHATRQRSARSPRGRALPGPAGVVRRGREAQVDAGARDRRRRARSLRRLFFYDAEADDAVAFARTANNALAEPIEPEECLLALAHLPLQVPGQVAAELDRCISELGFLGAQIGTSGPGGRPLDEAEFWPIFEVPARHRLPLMIHPTYAGPSRASRTTPHELAWKSARHDDRGRPADTRRGPGVLSRPARGADPRRRLPALPAWQAQPRLQCAPGAEAQPSESAERLRDRFFIDCITHADAQLELLASLVERKAVARHGPFRSTWRMRVRSIACRTGMNKHELP